MSRLNNREAAAAAAGSPAGPDVGVRSMSRAAGAALSLAGSETRSTRVVSAVSLESDEEDMRKLLGDSLDSTDSSVVKVGRPSSVAHKVTFSFEHVFQGHVIYIFFQGVLGECHRFTCQRSMF